MIPVLGIPYISRPDLFEATIRSINHPVEMVVVLDNSPGGVCPRIDSGRPTRYITMHRNMGVSWAWNTIIMNTREAPYWVISNSDLTFGTDLANIEAKMEAGVDLCLVDGMAVFGISANCVQQVGWFDLNFVPAYCEDNDYVWRAQKIGVKIDNIHPDYKHYGSATIKSSDGFRGKNSLSYPANVAYYQEKWGGKMGSEHYASPFNKGGSPKQNPALDFDRFRALSWD